MDLNMLVSGIINCPVRSRDQAEGRNERKGSWETRPFSNAFGSRTSVWGRLGMSPLRQIRSCSLRRLDEPRELLELG